MNVPLLAIVPYDAQLAEFDGSGRPLVELPRDAATSQAVETMAAKSAFVFAKLKYREDAP